MQREAVKQNGLKKLLPSLPSEGTSLAMPQCQIAASTLWDNKVCDAPYSGLRKLIHPIELRRKEKRKEGEREGRKEERKEGGEGGRKRKEGEEKEGRMEGRKGGRDTETRLFQIPKSSSLDLEPMPLLACPLLWPFLLFPYLWLPRVAYKPLLN